MRILRDLLSEDASAGAVCAGDVAGFRGSLFSPSKKREKEKRQKIRVVRFTTKAGPVSEATEKFDQADVISKLKASEKRNELNKDSVAFGIEDDTGRVTKVYVRAEQGEDFERALANALGREDDDEDQANSATEIADVLYTLRDKFDFVDICWPEIHGDEEEEIETIDKTPNEGEPAEGEPAANGAAVVNDDQESVKSSLAAVIDMLKANAEAEKAKAMATKAEADSKTAEANARAAEAKVRQEEEVLDMEAYYKDQATKDKEVKQLAKLAKFKHDMSRDNAEDNNVVMKKQTTAIVPKSDDEDEDEEGSVSVGSLPKTISREHFIDFLRAHLKSEK